MAPATATSYTPAMLDQVLLYVGAGFVAAWGLAHLLPTGSVVAGFGDISTDNRRIILMEWIVEGVALIGIGGFVAAATAMDHESAVARAVYGVAVAALLALAGVSLFTGFRIRFLPFRLCPLIFTAGALLIAIGGLM